jgi:hypothetical protein
MPIPAPFREQVLEDGFAIIPDVLRSEQSLELIANLENLGQSESILRRGGIFAIRNLLNVCPDIHQLAHSHLIRQIVAPILGGQALPVRGILFDKTPGANWKVPWHQDVTIAVVEKFDVEGFGPWSTKAGVPHVQPTPLRWLG